MSFSWLAEANAKRQQNDMFRRCEVTQPGVDHRFVVRLGKTCLNFSSNDYLGLATNPAAIAALTEEARRSGFGSTGSPLLSGYTEAQQTLEHFIADWLGFEACLVFNSGFAANAGVIAALFNDQDSHPDNCLEIHDKLNHASLLEHALIKKSGFRRFAHNSVSSLNNILAKSSVENKLVVTEGVFSMDGDQSPLVDIAASCEKYQAWLMVDDAHGIGTTGEAGKGSLFTQSDAVVRPEIYMATFGKALGGQGAFVCGDKTTIAFLMQRSKHFIYSTAMPAAVHRANLVNVQTAINDSWRREKLNESIAYFRQNASEQGIQLMNSNTAIQPVVIPGNAQVMTIKQSLLQQGVDIAAIRAPTVPKGSERLRISLSANHEKADIDQLINALSATMKPFIGRDKNADI